MQVAHATRQRRSDMLYMTIFSYELEREED